MVVRYLNYDFSKSERNQLRQSGHTSILKAVFTVVVFWSPAASFAQSVEQAQGELKRGYSELYDKSKASPHASMQKLNEIRDGSVNQRKIQMGQAISGQVSKAVQSKKGASSVDASEKSGGASSSSSSSSSRMKRNTRPSEPETQVGADGIPAVLDFKKKSP